MIRKNKIKPKVKTRAVPIYTKNISYDDLIEEINKTLPIKIKIKNIVDDIHEIYPLISKADIALIIRNTFLTIREQVLFGNKINVKFIFNDFHLKITKKNNFFCLEGKGTTFPKLRKMDYENE